MRKKYPMIMSVRYLKKPSNSLKREKYNNENKMPKRITESRSISGYSTQWVSV